MRRPSKQQRLSTAKVTRSDLSPRSLRLAEAGRMGVRVLIATGEEDGGFPFRHDVLTWELLVKLAEGDSAEEDWKDVLVDALMDVGKKRKLTGYVSFFSMNISRHTDMSLQAWIGASQMRGELKRRVVALISAHYGIPAASKAETMDLVNWLLEKGHFKYGGLDAKVSTKL